MLFERGDIGWCELMFHGQSIRESAHARRKTIARQAELRFRRGIEMGINRIVQPKRTPQTLESEEPMERVIGFEPTTLCLASTRSTN